MGKPELGLKITCSAGAVRFFDLTRSPAVCPKCGVVQAVPKPRWSQSHRPPAGWTKRPAAATAVPADVPAEADEIDADGEVIDPPDEVDEDDDDDIEIEAEPIRPADEV